MACSNILSYLNTEYCFSLTGNLFQNAKSVTRLQQYGPTFCFVLRSKNCSLFSDYLIKNQGNTSVYFRLNNNRAETYNHIYVRLLTDMNWLMEKECDFSHVLRLKTSFKPRIYYNLKKNLWTKIYLQTKNCWIRLVILIICV